MADDERYEKGREAFTRVMGFAVPPRGQANPLLDSTVENLFGEIWSREGLSTRDRRLITIVIVTCLMQGDYLKLHLQAALANGEFTAAELREVMLHMAYYAGWPVGTFGTGVVEQVARKSPA